MPCKCWVRLVCSARTATRDAYCVAMQGVGPGAQPGAPLIGQVALVANLVEQKDCWKTPFRGCVQSRDGWLLLNTAVVLDADGTFLVKYHKAHLWGEHALDASQEGA